MKTWPLLGEGDNLVVFYYFRAEGKGGGGYSDDHLKFKMIRFAIIQINQWFKVYGRELF